MLPWEDEEEYTALVASLAEEHAPRGPTEEHLVEEVAGILWRKRRLGMAEGAAHRRGLDTALAGHRTAAGAALAHITSSARSEEAGDAARTSAADDADEQAALEADEAMTRRAIEILNSQRNDAYEAALAELRDDTQEWWAQLIARDPDELEEGEDPVTADAEGLRRFITDRVMPWFDKQRSELTNRPFIREQAYGEGLDTFKLERLGRYEVHLDRKLERMLAMLIKLQDLRRPTATG